MGRENPGPAELDSHQANTVPHATQLKVVLSGPSPTCSRVISPSMLSTMNWTGRTKGASSMDICATPVAPQDGQIRSVFHTRVMAMPVIWHVGHPTQNTVARPFEVLDCDARRHQTQAMQPLHTQKTARAPNRVRIIPKLFRRIGPVGRLILSARQRRQPRLELHQTTYCRVNRCSVRR